MRKEIRAWIETIALLGIVLSFFYPELGIGEYGRLNFWLIAIYCAVKNNEKST